MTPMTLYLTGMENSPEYLAHHGVKGMKWGVWNSETRRKYGTPSGKKVVASKSPKTKAIAKAVGDAGSGIKRAASKTRKAAGTVIANAKAAKKERDAAKLSRNKAAALDAIERGDNKTFAKKARYLSDRELVAAQNRLAVKKQILADITPRQKAKGKSAVATALKNAGTSALQDLAKTAFTNIGKDAIDTMSKAAGAKIAQRVSDQAEYKTRLKYDKGTKAPDFGKRADAAKVQVLRNKSKSRLGQKPDQKPGQKPDQKSGQK